MLIFDEVVTGFRMSKGGAQGLYGVTPDMCTLAKILGGGLPGGAVTGKADIIDMIQLRDEPGFNSASRIGHNGTFNANPLSAAAGQKALELVKTQPINANADRAAARLRDGLNGLLNRMEITGTATGVASAVFLRLGVEVDPHDDEVVLTEEQERRVSDPVKKDQLTLAMYNHGVDGGPRFPGERDPLRRRHRPDGRGNGPGAGGHAGAGARLGAGTIPVEKSELIRRIGDGPTRLGRASWPGRR